MRTYTELCTLKTFEERYEYLKLGGAVGKETFGFDRYLNQALYQSPEWKQIRRKVILRDDGCDLGLRYYPIGYKIYIHHMNPITQVDILERSDILLNPEYLICVSHRTHNAIHYGDSSLLPQAPIERRPNDQVPWR